MNIEDLSVPELANAISQGSISRQQVLEHFGQATAHREETVRAFCVSDFDATAIAPATNISSAGTRLLDGIPVAIKDNICTKKFQTTACSSMLSEFTPTYDASVVTALEQAGALLVGKTNLDEFAMGSSTENSSWGITRNPWDTTRVPGGSSGGSAAAVAAGMVPLALGSDTGGSIRQPAAFCGVTGLKPTYGLVSRLGLIAFASSLDQIGPMARSAEDAAVLLNVIAAHDKLDSTSTAVAAEDYSSSLNTSLQGCRVGVCNTQLESEIDAPIKAAVKESLKLLESLGATIIDIELPHEKYAVATYYVVAPCEASSNLSRYDGVRYTQRAESGQLAKMYTKTRSEHFGPEVKRRVLLGTYALSSGYYDEYYLKASKVRRLIKQDFEQAFEQVDLIVGPTTPTTAFSLGEKTDDPIQMYLADVFTVSANLAGIPAMSIPCGFSDGLPIGLQLQGPAFSESRLLNVAHQFQSQTDWHQRRPA